jgi:hypothetical protein
MKLTIFTGVHAFGRFRDSFRDGEGFTSEEYEDCDRFDFELSEIETEQRVIGLLEDEESFKECMRGLPQSDINRYIHKCYRGEIEKELILEVIEANARKMVIDLWEEDCMLKVRKIYEQ